MAATAAAATAIPVAPAPAPAPVPADALPATSAQPTPVSSPGRQNIDTPAVWSRGGPVGAGTAGSRRSSVASSQPLTPHSDGGQGSEAVHVPDGRSRGGVASPQVARTFAALRHSAGPVRVAHDRSLLQQAGVCACVCMRVCVCLRLFECAHVQARALPPFLLQLCPVGPCCRPHFFSSMRAFTYLHPFVIVRWLAAGSKSTSARMPNRHSIVSTSVQLVKPRPESSPPPRVAGERLLGIFVRG